MAKKVLVAGGAGFLGSNLIGHLVSEGSEVICLDNLQTGRLENIAPFRGSNGFRFVYQDVTEPILIADPIDEIFNLACPASPNKYTLDPVHTFETSIVGAKHLLTLAEDKGARVLQASTSEVYGDPQTSPQPEDYRGLVNTFGPRACYDEGKRAAETLFYEYGIHRGLETRVVRIFNTYGPRMAPDDGRVVSNFIVQALKGHDLTVYGDGKQTRSFCYVDDMINGLVRLMRAPDGTKAPVNLGNPGEFTIVELAEMVLAKTGSTSRIVHHDLPQDDPQQRRPDITRAKQQLGWQPHVALSEGLDRTIAYFRNEIGLCDEPKALSA